MPDLIRFTIATAMRLGEIILLKGADTDEEDRTIIIRDRTQDECRNFPTPARKSGKQIIADVRDTGKYLDDCRTRA